MKKFVEQHNLEYKELKEVLGHTPVQVTNLVLVKLGYFLIYSVNLENCIFSPF